MIVSQVGTTGWGRCAEHERFWRNFDVSVWCRSMMIDEVRGGVYEEDEEDDTGLLVPGHLCALHPFEPEGSSEMALENQVVSIIGRGGGLGWAVVRTTMLSYRRIIVPVDYLVSLSILL